MPLNITEFKGALTGDGARPNMFQVTIDNPVEQLGNFKTPFLVKVAEIPAATIGEIQLFYQGRPVKYAGDRTFADWTVTIINDEGFLLRNAFEEWSNLIADLGTNLGATDPSAYMTNAKVYQLGRGSTPSSKDNTGTSNAVLKEYEFIDIFPTNVSQIDLSYDSSDTIEEFTVEFQVQSFSYTGQGTPNG